MVGKQEAIQAGMEEIRSRRFIARVCAPVQVLV